MKKNYNYEEIERWARAGFKGAERHAKYTPKRNGENTVNRTESGFFHSFGFQLAGALLVVLIVSGGIFAALKYMERIAGINNPAQTGDSRTLEESDTTPDPEEQGPFLTVSANGSEYRIKCVPTRFTTRTSIDTSGTQLYDVTFDYGTQIWYRSGVMTLSDPSGRGFFEWGWAVYNTDGEELASAETGTLSTFSRYFSFAADYLASAQYGTYLVRIDVTWENTNPEIGESFTVYSAAFTVVKTDEDGQTLPETGAVKPPYDKNGKYPAYLSVTSGAETIYPDAHMLFMERYDDENGVWLSADGIGAAGAERVPLIRYDGSKNIDIDYYRGIDIANILYRCSLNGKIAYGYYDLTDAEDGVYRFTVSFVINGRQIGSQYERVCYEYPFDVEVKRDTSSSNGWDSLDKTGRIERALDEITAYGINYQRWRYLCGADHADDIYDDGGYYIDDPAEAEFTYDYLLGRYDSETDPNRRVLMFVFISYYLEATWDDSEHGFPYSLKYMPSGDTFKKPANLSEADVSGCDEWLHVKYYGEFCKYASQMKENDVKTKYPASYKLIKKYGFNGFSDSAQTPEQKANRTLQEFFNMALSVKYGIAVTDPSSEKYYNWDDTGSGLNVYGPGDKVYQALLKYYPEELLGADSNNAPFACEQSAGIKYINEWRSYFTSLTSKEIADGFIKESKCFLTTSDGLVLTVDNYYFFNTNNLNTPSAGELYSFKINGDRATAQLFVDDIDDNRNYTVEFSVKDGVYKITGGTLVTEWLERTLSVEECQIRDTVMDVEKLFQLIDCGAGFDFRYYTFDVIYDIKYGENKGLPEGLEEKLNEMSVRETPDGRKYYIDDHAKHSSYGLSTYDDWIRYFSNILPEDLVRSYIKEKPWFVVTGGNVYTLATPPQSWYEIDYSTFRIIGEKDGVTTVSAVLTGIYTESVSQNNFEVTFELVKTGDIYKYRVTGGTFIDIFMDGGANVSKAAHSAYKLIRASDLLLCADASVVYIEKYYKYSGEADGSAYVAYNCYGKEMFSDLLDFSATEQIRNAVMKDTEVMKWVEFDQRIFYPVIYPGRAEFTVRPKFAETQDMTVHGLIENMKNYKETEEKITFSLDFILQYKNGKTKNVTYTFEVDKTNGCRVTGGTFVTDFILAK